MATNSDTPKAPGCSTPLKGCLIIVGLAMMLLMATMIYLARLPSVQELAVCKLNMTDVSEAISRYEDVNGQPPPNLRVLASHFLKKPSVLRCPLDKSHDGQPSYTYYPKAKDHQVMLECGRHRFAGQPTKLRILADGTFAMVAEQAEKLHTR